MLPEIKKVTTRPNVFEATWQAVIFRNYGLVPNDVLANLLDCDIKTLQSEALRLGLKNVTATSNFNKKSYITLIRNNWLLLPYEQICQLLDCDREYLSYILKEDDYLGEKLGEKCDCPVFEKGQGNPVKLQKKVWRTLNLLALTQLL